MEEAPYVQRLGPTRVRFNGRTLSYFSGCDYFGLSCHPKVLGALERGLARYGLSVSASRITTGNHPLYPRLEEALARFFGAESALLLPSGYQANLALAQGLAGRFSSALIDERAHPTLLDASQLLKCPVFTFKHKDIQDLRRLIRSKRLRASTVLLTDGMFAHDGSVAPLRAYQSVLPKTAVMIVDDAHAAGTLGKTGKGSLELTGANRRGIIQTMTLSKAFGSFGGAILADRKLRGEIVARSTIFVGGTPLPLPLANAALESLGLLGSNDRLRKRLMANQARVVARLAQRGFNISPVPGPIVVVQPERERLSRQLETHFLRHKIYPPLTKYPGTGAAGLFRCVISSEHTISDLDNLVNVLADALDKGWIRRQVTGPVTTLAVTGCLS